MQYILNITFALLLTTPWIIATDNSQAYCYKNTTEISYKVVTKTRIKSVSSKNILRKMIFKKDTQVEIYEDQEPVYKIKVERFCCEGYKMNEYDLCEPQCVENGCPQHSRCVEPEVCECKSGYFSVRSVGDGKHYCEPICKGSCPHYSECVGPNQCACKNGYHNLQKLCKPYCASGCPHDGECVAHNKCNCPDGYKSEKGSCLPLCSLGDQCQNGDCVAKDHCVCYAGFIWNNETLMCESVEGGTYSKDFIETTESFIKTETTNDDINPSQVFDKNIETTTYYVTDEYGPYTTPLLEMNTKCPHDYVFHMGQCRPLKFVSNEINCWLKPCQDENTKCLENGTCVCSEGFKWFNNYEVDHNSLNPTVKRVCLSDADYEARMQQRGEDHLKATSQDNGNWTIIFFIVLGTSILVAALVFLAFKLFHRQSGEIDVEGKNLSCVYDHRVCNETEKSVF